MTRNETHVHDLTTLANFKDWAQSIGAALTAFGWTQSSDTGQVNWSTIAAVPTSNNYVYEIWQPGDGGTAFYIRIDYGNNGGTSPAIKIQGGTSTNGSGTLTGFTTTQTGFSTQSNSGSTLFNCLYSGDSSSFAIMMWRDANSGFNGVIAVDRSRNSSGATTNAYFTVMCGPRTFLSVTFGSSFTQSVVFGVGTAPFQGVGNATYWPMIQSGMSLGGGGQSMLFNGNIGFLPIFPYIGYHDVPVSVIGAVNQVDFTELAVVSVTLLSLSRTFIFSKNQNFAMSTDMGQLIRWD